MMNGIASEFAEPVNGPQSTRLHEVYQLPEQKFWVALDGEKVVGTVGLVLLPCHNAVLKRMMTDRAYRGRSTGLATRLLQTALSWGHEHGVRTVYLGTMGQFVAAQRFYTRHGFVLTPENALPSTMPVNPIDSLHYRLDLP